MVRVIKTNQYHTSGLRIYRPFFLLFLLVITPTSAQNNSQLRYNIIDLGTLGGLTSTALGINNHGQVVGAADTPEGLRHAYLWENGVMTDLGTFGSHSQSEAWSINNHGQVVGTSSNTFQLGISFLWENGEMTRLVEGNSSFAFDINDLGQVVGSLGGQQFSSAFMWDNGVITDMGTLGGNTATAYGINESSQVTGFSTAGIGPDGLAIPGGAFLWENGVLNNLGTLGSDKGSAAYDINDLGQIVGEASRDIGDVSRYLFLWENGVMTDLSVLISPQFGGNVRGFFVKINNTGMIIGFFYLYDINNNIFYLIEDLIPSDSGWSDMDTRDINDRGQIIGTGTFNGLRRAFLMSPAGACCDGATGICEDNVFPEDCAGDLHTFALNTGCEEIICEPVMGACCDSNSDQGGRCTQTFFSDCQDSLLTWSGLASCEEIICEEVRGSCCERLHGVCRDNALRSECTNDQPLWRIETRCDEVMCDPFVGACCNTRFGTCTDSTLFTDCQGENLSWIKSQACTNQTCPDPFIPTVSEWGLVVLTLLLLIGAKIYFNRQLYSIPK